MIIIIFKPAASGVGIFISLLLVYILYSIVSTIFTYISAFAVCIALIVAILIVGIIMLSMFRKSGLCQFLTVLITIGLIIGVIIAKPDIIGGHITSDFIGAHYESALYKAAVNDYKQGNYPNAMKKFSKAVDHYGTRLNEVSEYFPTPDEAWSQLVSGKVNFNILNIKYGKIYSDLIPNTVAWYDEYLERKSSDEFINFVVDKSNLGDMYFCSVLWEKMISTKDQKYEKWIQEICSNNLVTLTEIEAFYETSEDGKLSQIANIKKDMKLFEISAKLLTGMTDEVKAMTDLSLYYGKLVVEVKDISEASRWISKNARKGGTYTIILGTDQLAENLSFGYGSKDVTVIFATTSGEKTIKQSNNPEYPLITINGKATTFTLEEGVILFGINEQVIVMVNKGTFIMNGGTITGGGRGVHIFKDGSFIMSGGAITGNTEGGGVYSLGTFTMTNGVISENTVTIGEGGGVYFRESTFFMKGGVISGNTAGFGGGVYGFIRKSGRFTKSGGVIYGSDAPEELANKALRRLPFDNSQDNGAAILLSDGKKLQHYTGINRTVNEEIELDSGDHRKNRSDRSKNWGFSKGF
jgi:hypothetical protein